ITFGGSLIEGFMPETSEKILRQFNTKKRDLADMNQFGLYPSGNSVTDKPEILFARMDIKEVLAKVDAMHAAEEAASSPAKAPESDESDAGQTAEAKDIDLECKPEITYDDFAKLQFAVGEIIACEAVPKSKKLLCSQVKIGNQVRQILSGIKAWYTPEEMVGKKVMVVVNLKPAKLAGMMSEGMLLCAEGPDGSLALMTPEKDMPAGAEIC
ncbi:MAG: methionine--tRNA ligase subunit beta, partial [Clostridiales bacterium]|nr:methionine--tRNA ligase subunit beta [Clostridiales bacterium]